MKFKAGDPVDADHCVALEHETLRCHDAFKEFETFATLMIAKGPSRWVSCRTYNAYSSFLFHLYEFMRGAHAREKGNKKITSKRLTNDEKARLDEAYVSHQAQRILTNRRIAIQNNTVPTWENALSYYPEKIPREFAREFRKFRNSHGHVNHERSKLNLSEFYQKYHKYIFMLYRESLYWMGTRVEEFPDMKKITDFSVLIAGEMQNFPSR